LLKLFNILDKEILDKKKLDKEKLNKEKLDKEKLDKEKLDKEKERKKGGKEEIIPLTGKTLLTLSIIAKQYILAWLFKL